MSAPSDDMTSLTTEPSSRLDNSNGNPWKRSCLAQSNETILPSSMSNLKSSSTAATSLKPRGVLTLVEIIAQQEEERNILDEIQQYELKAFNEEEDGEDAQLRLAIEASLNDVVPNPPIHTAMPNEDVVFTKEEWEQIQNALRESEDYELAQEVASLDLARVLHRQEQERLQEEELVKQQQELKSSSSASYSHHQTIPHQAVRILPSSEFYSLKYNFKQVKDTDTIDYTAIQQYSNYMQQTYEDEIYFGDDGPTGYRINEKRCSRNNSNTASASTTHSSWVRVSGGAIIGPDGEVRTKHDVQLKNWSNARRLGLGLDGNSNTVAPVNDAAYNGLRNKLKKSTLKGVASHGHGRAENMTLNRTRGGAIDGVARLQIQKAINLGIISRVNGAVKEGKEAIVYHAAAAATTTTPTTPTAASMDYYPTAEDVAIKVFKRIQEFRKRGEYVDGDPRYYRKSFHSYDKREQVELWAEKEYRNLSRAYQAGVPCPRPLLQKQNLLFMQFLGGNDGWPCPQLREVTMSSSTKWTHLYCQCMVAVRRLYHCARLVHADLSEYNILLCPSHLLFSSRHEDPINKIQQKEEVGPTTTDEGELQIALIDFGQAVHISHPSAAMYLERDLIRLQQFFSACTAQVLNLDDSRNFILSPCEDASLSLEEDFIMYDDDVDPDKSQQHVETNEMLSSDAAENEKCISNNKTLEDGRTDRRGSPLTRIWDDEKEYQRLQSLLGIVS
jgi:serine/threonine-protein kinase RIO1